MNFQTLVKNTQRKEFYYETENNNNKKSAFKSFESNHMNNNKMNSNKFDGNIHLKNNVGDKFYVNDKILNYSVPDLKFNKISNEKTLSFQKKSKFSWQLNEFNY